MVIGIINPNVPNTNADPVSKEQVLIVAGGQKYAHQAFSSIKRIYKSVNFTVDSYPYSERLGSGREMTIDLNNISKFNKAFITIDQGTLSEQSLKELADFVLAGGKLYLLFDSKAKQRHVASMEENSNQLLKMLEVDDELVYKSTDLESKLLGTLVEISDKERRRNSSRYNKNRLKKVKNKSVSAFKSTMGSGHYIERKSKLKNASVLLEFNSSSEQYTTNAFWDFEGGGVLGIGTEAYTSGKSPAQVYHAGKAIWTTLSKIKSENDIKEKWGQAKAPTI